MGEKFGPLSVHETWDGNVLVVSETHGTICEVEEGGLALAQLFAEAPKVLEQRDALAEIVDEVETLPMFVGHLFEPQHEGFCPECMGCILERLKEKARAALAKVRP